MRIAVLGAGLVGRTLAGALLSAGHEVVLGARSAQSPALVEWRDTGSGGGEYAAAVSGADVVVVALPGLVAAEVVAGVPVPAGAVVLDVSNPLELVEGEQPTVHQFEGRSAGEVLQDAIPQASVVKALNTVAAGVMVDPGPLGPSHVLPIAGDEAAAKEIVIALLGDLGWRPEQILDLGDLSAARGTEAYLLLWGRIVQALGTSHFNIRLIHNGYATSE